MEINGLFFRAKSTQNNFVVWVADIELILHYPIGLGTESDGLLLYFLSNIKLQQ